MAQPSSLADARAAAVALGTAAATPTETVALGAAAGRVAAEDVAVRIALPLFDGSAMDGWAVRAADVAGAGDGTPVGLRIADEARAGHPSAVALARGTAARISTGARLPAGADAVVRSEDAEPAGDAVAVRVAVAIGSDVRRAGEDVVPGDGAVLRGEVLHAGRIALLAGTGVTAVRCRRRPRVTLIVTGDEVADGVLGDAEVHDVNGPALAALLAAAGAEVVATVRVGDDREATRRAFAAAEGDVVVSCGGVSVGPHDHVRPALAALGAQEHVGAVALQPGKPAWLGALPGTDGPRPVVALPGNPGAAVVCATLLAVPLLRACEGRAPAAPRYARLAAGTHGDERRVRALRATLRTEPDGGRTAIVLDGQQPHRLGSLARTEALALVPPSAGALAAGAVVEVVSLPGAGD
jgi:molybdopterin molybdotransferase